jgi:phosphohistidine phosphatase
VNVLIHLLRHGIAVDRADPDCPPEAERYLTKKGKLRSREAARGLAWLSIEPDLVLTSPWLRARQTADIAVEEIGCKARPETSDALLWDAAPARLLKQLVERKPESALCVGHAPHLDVFIAYLVGCELPLTELRKAGLAVLHADRLAPGRGVLLAIYPPRVLRQLPR